MTNRIAFNQSEEILSHFLVFGVNDKIKRLNTKDFPPKFNLMSHELAIRLPTYEVTTKVS